MVGAREGSGQAVVLTRVSQEVEDTGKDLIRALAKGVIG
jgi:hypothetical protein